MLKYLSFFTISISPNSGKFKNASNSLPTEFRRGYNSAPKIRNFSDSRAKTYQDFGCFKFFSCSLTLSGIMSILK